MSTRGGGSVSVVRAEISRSKIISTVMASKKAQRMISFGLLESGSEDNFAKVIEELCRIKKEELFRGFRAKNIPLAAELGLQCALDLFSIFDASEHQKEDVKALLKESSISSPSMRSIRAARTLSIPRRAVNILLQDIKHRLVTVCCSHSIPELLIQRELDQLVESGEYVPCLHHATRDLPGN